MTTETKRLKRAYRSSPSPSLKAFARTLAGTNHPLSRTARSWLGRKGGAA